MRKSVKTAIENVLNQYILEYNIPETRKEITDKLHESTRIPFKDLTTIEDVNNNTIRFRGYDARTNKMVDLIMQSTTIKYKEFYENL